MGEQRFDFPAQNLVARTRFFQEEGRWLSSRSKVE
jgi:hypothetical protein